MGRRQYMSIISDAGMGYAVGAVEDEWAESAKGAGYTSLGRSPRKLAVERAEG